MAIEHSAAKEPTFDATMYDWWMRFNEAAA